MSIIKLITKAQAGNKEARKKLKRLFEKAADAYVLQLLDDGSPLNPWARQHLAALVRARIDHRQHRAQAAAALNTDRSAALRDNVADVLDSMSLTRGSRSKLAGDARYRMKRTGTRRVPCTKIIIEEINQRRK